MLPSTPVEILSNPQAFTPSQVRYAAWVLLHSSADYFGVHPQDLRDLRAYARIVERG